MLGVKQVVDHRDIWGSLWYRGHGWGGCCESSWMSKMNTAWEATSPRCHFLYRSYTGHNNSSNSYSFIIWLQGWSARVQRQDRITTSLLKRNSEDTPCRPYQRAKIFKRAKLQTHKTHLFTSHFFSLFSDVLLIVDSQEWNSISNAITSDWFCSFHKACRISLMLRHTLILRPLQLTLLFGFGPKKCWSALVRAPQHFVHVFFSRCFLRRLRYFWLVGIALSRKFPLRFRIW